MSDSYFFDKLSNDFRQINGLNTLEPIYLRSLLQKLNVITLFVPLSGAFSGMATKAPKENNGVYRFMLINSAHSVGKQNFTICHELYHLYVQENFTNQICVTGEFNKGNDIEEYNADVFASHLLLPTDGLLKCIPVEEINQQKVSLSTILFIEQFYSSSRKALLHRLKGMGLIGREEYDEYSKNVIASALAHGFSPKNYQPNNDKSFIGDYGAIAKKLYENDVISQSYYYALLSDLGIDLSLIENQTDGE